MLGPARSGKTSLLTGEGAIKYITTIGVDFKVRKLGVDEKLYRIQGWDTAGEKRFKVLTTSYVHGGSGLIFVYDVSKRESFN